jgi:hypothetical protein
MNADKFLSLRSAFIRIHGRPVSSSLPKENGMTRFGLRAGVVLGSALAFWAWGQSSATGQMSQGGSQVAQGTTHGNVKTVGKGAGNVGKGAAKGTEKGAKKVGNEFKKIH